MSRIGKSVTFLTAMTIVYFSAPDLPAVRAQSPASAPVKSTLPQINIDAKAEQRRQILERVLRQAGVKYRIDCPLASYVTMRARGSLPYLLTLLLRDESIVEMDAAGRTHTIFQQYGYDIDKDGIYHIYAKPLWKGLPERPDLHYKEIRLATSSPMPLSKVLEIIFTQVNLPYTLAPEIADLKVDRTDIGGRVLPYALDIVLSGVQTPITYRFEKGVCILEKKTQFGP